MFSLHFPSFCCLIQSKSKQLPSEVRFKERTFRACTQISTLKFCFIVFYPYFCGVNQYIRTMQIVTTREFRANQKKYFEMAETETILVSRRNAAPIMVCAVREGDFPSKEELAAIQRGIDDVRNGNTFRMAKNESLDDFLNRIEDEGNV